MWCTIKCNIELLLYVRCSRQYHRTISCTAVLNEAYLVNKEKFTVIEKLLNASCRARLFAHLPNTFRPNCSVIDEKYEHETPNFAI